MHVEAEASVSNQDRQLPGVHVRDFPIDGMQLDRLILFSQARLLDTYHNVAIFNPSYHCSRAACNASAWLTSPYHFWNPLIEAEMPELSINNNDPAFATRLPGLSNGVKVLQIIVGGLITGLLQVVLSVSHASLVYGGKLSPYLGQGIGFALAGAFIIATVVALFSSQPGTVGSNQDVSVAIFSIISISIISSMPSDAPLENVFLTVVSTIALTTFLTGLFFLCLGTFRLGELARYLPYPVVGGFLAGTGWLLFKGGFYLMGGYFSHTAIFDSATIIKWAPSLVLALLMVVGSKRTESTLVLPGIIFAGVLAFYFVAWFLECSKSDLAMRGWLLAPFDDPFLWKPFPINHIHLADWIVIMGQAANIFTVLMVSCLSILLNASGLELALKKDVDLNRELQISGFGNLLSGFIPGFVGFMQISLTTLNYKLNARSRMVGLIAVTLIGFSIYYGASIITYFPKFIMGAVLMYLGLTFLLQWACETWAVLPKIDIFIIWMILIIIAIFGFLPGVATGFMAAVIMFAVSCSRTEVVRHELTGKTYRSQVTRSIAQRQVLDRTGDKIYILQLQGFIFFGTVDRLFKKIKKQLDDNQKPTPEFIVLDFARVENLDSTGMLSFNKLKELTLDSNIHIIITTPTKKIKRQLEKGGLPSSSRLIHYFANLDAGLEWCEEIILKREGGLLEAEQPKLEKQLHMIFPDIANLTKLIDCLERLEVAPGDIIIKQGQRADTLFFIESGRVTIQLDQPNGPPVRLETMKSSRIVGEIGFYLGQRRSASVIADQKSVVYQISSRDLKEIENTDPETANIFHRVVVHLMAERFLSLIKTVNDLQK